MIANFALQSASQAGPSTVKVTMTAPPSELSPDGAADALNPGNWAISGPGLAGNAVVRCGVVYGDPFSVYLFTSGSLVPGAWTVVASNLRSAAGAALSAPTSVKFVAATIPVAVAPGSIAETDTAFAVLRKHLNPALVGPAWDAILAAIAVGEDANARNSELAFDQLYTSSASGFYLDRRAGDSGIRRPAGVGMPDDLFSEYAIRSTTNQLTEGALLDVMEVFYGADALRAHEDTTASAPFALHDGDDLLLLLDENTPVTVIFASADFGVIGSASAVEVAAAISRSLRAAGTNAFAIATTDPTTGVSRVRIYSGTIGLGSSVRVVGGKAQTALQFPTPLAVFSGLPTWTLTYLAASSTLRFTPSGSIDLSQVRVGDYVAIYGTEFNAANRGTWTITNVYWAYPGGVLTQYFDVVNLQGVAQGGVAQVAAADLMLFRPARASIHDVQARAVVVASLPSEADIVLPATSRSVGRGLNSGAYPPSQPVKTITSASRSWINGTTTVVCPSHGLSAGEWVFIDGVVPTMTAPAVTSGNGSTTTDYSIASLWSTGTGFHSAHADSHWCGAVTLNDGKVILAGGTSNSLGAYGNDDLLRFTGSTPQSGGLATQWTLANSVDTGSTFSAQWNITALVMWAPTANGDVLMVGNGGGTANRAYYYTPNFSGFNGTWTATGAMVTGVGARALVNRSLTDGNVMAIGGGSNSGGASAACEYYKFLGNSWTTQASMSVARIYPGAVQLLDGTILACGGATACSKVTGNTYDFDYTNASDITATNACEVYTQGSNTWATVGSMCQARVGHYVLLMSNGEVLVVGGIGRDPSFPDASTYLNTTEIYNPTQQRWRRGPSMFAARAFFAAGVLGNRLYVAGGSPTDTSTEYLDLTTMRWTRSPAKLPHPILKTSGVVSNGLLVMAYGVDGSNQATDRGLYVLTPGAESWANGGVNGLQKVASVVDLNTFTFSSPSTTYTATTGGTALGCSAPAMAIGGPHTYDTHDGVAITGSKSTTTQQLTAGGRYASVTVADATQFPDAPGWIVFNFGYANQVGPVRYLGRLSSTAIALDYTFQFPYTAPSGSTVRLLGGSGAYVPPRPETEQSFYLTAAPAGRVAAVAAATSIAAAGVPLDVSITYPGDRGLAGEGLPVSGAQRLSDRVVVWGSDDVDADVAAAREA